LVNVSLTQVFAAIYVPDLDSPERRGSDEDDEGVVHDRIEGESAAFLDPTELCAVLLTIYKHPMAGGFETEEAVAE
jgi:hypothetical protein